MSDRLKDRRSFIGKMLMATTAMDFSNLLPPEFARRKTRSLAQSPKLAEMRKNFWMAPKVAVVQPPVIPPGSFSITGIALHKPNITVTWQNGTGPFQLQQSTKPSGPWTNASDPTNQHSSTVSAPNPVEFYRVKQSIEVLSYSAQGAGTLLTWWLPL